MRVTDAGGTKDRILDAAERLFAERGLGGTSMRAVTSEAGVNLAAVNYHFGSKEALLGAVVRRTVAPITAELIRSAEELEGKEPSVEELVEAFVTPFLEVAEGEGERGRYLAGLIGRVLVDPDGRLSRVASEAVGEADERFVRALGRALPHLSPDELRWRYLSCMGTIAVNLVGMLSGRLPLEVAPMDIDERRARMVAFLAGSLKAPAADAPAAEANARSGSRRSGRAT